MRAIVVEAPGGPEALKTVEVDDPAPGPGQVRIRVAAAAVNPVDAATRSGALAAAGRMPAFGAPGSRPAIGIGWDVAGTVDATGAGATRFAAGDRVVGLRDRLDLALGTQADLVVLDEDAVAAAPRSVDAAHTATLPLNGLTAAQSLDLLGLPAGSTLLVTGAAGAVGGYAVELAADRGLRVVARAAAADEDLVRGLGAEFFVPRGAHLGDAVRALVPGGVDGAVDAALLSGAALDAVRGGGAFAAVNGGAAVPTPLRGIRVHTGWIREDVPGQLAGLVAAVDAGRLTPPGRRGAAARGGRTRRSRRVGCVAASSSSPDRQRSGDSPESDETGSVCYVAVRYSAVGELSECDLIEPARGVDQGEQHDR